MAARIDMPAQNVRRCSSGASTVQYLLLVYVDDKLLGELPPTAFDAEMKQCLQHADEMQSDGKLVSFQQLEAPATARSVRVRGDKTSVLDGPFAETKEVLAGFNLVEAASIEEAVRMALEFPWVRYGCIEVRAVRDVQVVRKRVGA
jgi:hypothetical protein